jgi:hypothetical protein
MFAAIYLKELASHLKGLTFYIFAGLLAFGTALFLSETRPGVTFLFISFGREWHNAPIIIARLLASYTLVGVLFTMIIAGRAVAKDFSARVHEFFFTVPMTKLQYLGGRFAGGLSANLLSFGAVLLGLLIAGLRLPPGYYGPFRPWSFIAPLLVIVLPNLILTGSVFFALATLTRKMVNTYVAGVIFVLAYVLSSLAFTRFNNDLLRILADPFAISALTVLTKYWTVAEMNVNPMPLDPRLLLNRVIWLAAAGGVMYVTWRRFRFVSVLEGKRQGGQAIEAVTESSAVQALGPLMPSTVERSLSCRGAQFLDLARREFKRIALHPAFIILTVMAMGELLTNFLANVNEANNEVYPFTSFFLQYTEHIWIYMIPITILFGGLIVWRERDNHSHEFYDTMPVPHGLSLASKLAALLSVQFCYVLLAMAIGIVIQTGTIGLPDIEPGLYLKGLFGIEFMKFAFVAVLVVFIQNLSPNKYVGYLIATGWVLGDLALYQLVPSASPLFRYGHIPKYIYSNLNGFGHYGPMILWYTAYWLLLAALLVLSASLLWRHGNETGLRHRFRLAGHKIRRLQFVWLMLLSLSFLGTGGFIYYNRHVLNTYQSTDDLKKMKAAYEQKFGKYRAAPQPVNAAVSLNIDLFPEQRLVLLKGGYRMVNKTRSVIPEIYVTLSDRSITKINRLDCDPPARLLAGPEEFGFRVFALQQPLQPGDSLSLEFDLEVGAEGFTDNNPKSEIAANGSCIVCSGVGGNNEYFPGIGFNKELMLTDRMDRKRYGLPEQDPVPTLEAADPAVPYGSNHPVLYDAIFSTSGDQIVVSNGDLVRQWRENGRSHFHYRSDTSIHDEFIFASGRYQVTRDTHAGVAIEVYYDAKHPYNVRRMINGVKGGLDFCNRAFSPYPYRVQRIVEIPDYMEEGGARSQPTVFIWRESAGFVSNLGKPNRPDRVFGIAAHELGHQWWAYIVGPAYAEGVYQSTENICQYVWVMCLEKEYGTAMSRSFLKQEMETYLKRRKRDTKGERPLMRSLEGQAYLAYEKGGLALYALQDYIGPEKVNQALGAVVRDFGFRNDRYVTARDVVDALKAATPDSLQYLVGDLFERITLYENQVRSVQARRMDDGKYQVELSLTCKKFYADSVGNQTPAALNDYVAVGVLGTGDSLLYLQKHRFTSQDTTITVAVDAKPAMAGIDPFGILIDRNRDDNLAAAKVR